MKVQLLICLCFVISVMCASPPGVICAQTVCPTVTALLSKRAACPVSCPESCYVIDDVCCPGNQKTVCKKPSGSVATLITASITRTISPTSTKLTAIESSTTIKKSSSINQSIQPSATNTDTAQSNSVKNIQFLLSTLVLTIFVTIGILY